ncbi:AFR039Cp [Eremothecium gossypii ATCC 10895]|uniref:Prefoldin subunit 4 n=1 Tax=Eremothecium gossypii (strain ATCC 10895 / CBS 109.51 / FGSC 9923 / NRRL Y-1056) TaxID=284811 RepID=Q754N3_EREGS|nr:AFR039Cp [Eremothecium gossypii ATCC 10895]AAS53410.2 AFR039Cp [Eremothecium gossypii ATCC 10895]AEY97721.1 FAFR039Cp [Eremothecium gossypii FDAG1]
MELLPQGKQNTVQVLYEDQQRINEFSKLVMRKDALEAELRSQRQEKEYVDDAALEIELVDEDAALQYKIGDVFVLMRQEEVAAQLERDQAAADARIRQLEEEEEHVDARMRALKQVLYAKFGDSINLER